MKYAFIEEHRSGFRVKKMCRVLAVSRSGYYKWSKHIRSIRRKENERLLIHIKEAYVRGRGSYGSPRVTAELKDKGISCGKNRIVRLMKQNGIKAKTKRRFKATTKNKHDILLADNLLNQRFYADEANKIWVSDITFIRTREGWFEGPPKTGPLKELVF